jgi:PAS domain S-box-containing protein
MPSGGKSERPEGKDRGTSLDVLPEAYFRALVEQAADGIFISTEDGRYVVVNPSGHRMLGYEPGELVGKRILDILPASEQARLDQEVDQVIRGQVRTQEWTFLRKDGAPLAAEVTAQPIAGGILAIVRDLGPRRAFERKIRESEATLRSILETAPDIIMTVDRAGTILFINRTLPPLSLEDVVGTCCFDYVPPESRGRVEAAIEKVFTTRTLDEYEIQGPPNPAGVRVWSSVRAGPLIEGDHVVAATLCATDVTHRRESEQQEARLREQLLHAQRLESVGRLAGGVAHDFNNLLTSMLGFIALAREELPKDSPTAELLDRAAESANRGAALTQQLLAFARKKMVRPELVAFDDVLERMAPMLRRLVGENLEVKLTLAGERGLVRVDLGSLEQVVMNLVVNARDAIRGTGRITLETRDVVLDEAYCREHPETAPGRHVMLAVSDTGAGMAPEVLARVFEPFYTTKPVGEGSGLGLAMCEGIVRQAGGSIAVHSALGAGARFEVYLPRAAGVARAAEPRGDAARSASGGHETLLLVEDEPTILALARRVLTGLGYEVLTARDGVEALEVAARSQRPIALLITDVVMPNLGGRELAERLTARRPGLRVLYSSGYATDAIDDARVLGDVVSFLEKPYTLDALAARVRQILDE